MQNNLHWLCDIVGAVIIHCLSNGFGKNMVGRAIQIIDMRSERVPHENGASDIRAWIKAKCAELLSDYPQVQAIGVGFGGPLETDTGRV